MTAATPTNIKTTTTKPLSSLSKSQISEIIQSLIDNLVGIKDESGEFLLHLEDGTIIDTKGWNDWEWTHGIGLYGLWKFYEITKNPDTLKVITDWFDARIKEEETKKRHRNINTMAVFLTLAYVYEHQGKTNEVYREYLDSWAEWAMNDLNRTKYGGLQHVTYVSLHEGQLWDDTLMMTVVPLAKIGYVLDRPHYIEEAKRQFFLHIQFLFDTKTGLFFHGWQFSLDKNSADVGHNFAEALWARGNSWITIVIPEFIELLNLNDENDSLRIHLINSLTSQIDALVRLQNEETGLWHTLIDDSTSYLEASASAGFAYGIMKSVRKGYVTGEHYQKAALKGVQAVIDNTDEAGELINVSFGTPMGETKQFYKEIPLTSMPYGQAMAMMCLVEYLNVL